ncbi:MAG: 3-deoxy-7-phosphoheptulonate synthase [SAR86 cluster bacterium]|uniref:Phospho-2-dehydro-3-deoxyheptonate aldolase n=1 Tax=SAR86 cluster bacterium TaxID=2030880 RepID=A0A2A5B2X5_9GAMM|nr:MAG: 3-deoxy-7-phosphoheptulonate synthase [SAR86 cluster bacterium]
MPDRVKEIDNLHIIDSEELPTPGDLKNELVLKGKALSTVTTGHRSVKDVLDREDARMIVVVGPCSIHNREEALEYARKLKPLADELADELLILMRVYFEKPRTSVGWEGLIYDPHLDGSHKIDQGLHIGRQLMLDITEIGLPIAIEALDLISPQYLQDLVAWTAIGARTTESPTHRKLASGISSAVGFKNNVDGGVMVAVNAIRSAAATNSFISITEEGKVALFRTSGNPHCHVILRGGKSPNYDKESVAACEAELQKAGLAENIMIDCSHGNSSKDPQKQKLVLDDVSAQINNGNKSIIGVMIESNLEEGNQPIPDDLDDLKYGVSITDACINWGATEILLRDFAQSIGSSLKSRSV